MEDPGGLEDERMTDQARYVQAFALTNNSAILQVRWH